MRTMKNEKKKNFWDNLIFLRSSNFFVEGGIAPDLSSFESREIVIVPRLTLDIEYRYIVVNIVHVKMKE